MSGSTNFPTSADDFSTASPTNLGDADTTGRTHSQRHDDAEAALEAVEAALLSGTGALNMTLQAGAAATPSLKFTGDTNTGIWSPGADVVAVSTGGTERLRIGADGNSILAASSSSAALRVTQTGSGDALLIEDAANVDSTPFVVTALGDVGIGTGSPGYKLDVNGTINSTALYVNGSAFRGGATGGSTDAVFYENDTTVTADYTITTNKNAGSFGPITINAGITVTVPSGSVWSVV